MWAGLSDSHPNSTADLGAGAQGSVCGWQRMQPRVIPGVLVNGIKLGQRERGRGELELKAQAGGSAEMDGGRGVGKLGALGPEPGVDALEKPHRGRPPWPCSLASLGLSPNSQGDSRAGWGPQPRSFWESYRQT